MTGRYLGNYVPMDKKYFGLDMWKSSEHRGEYMLIDSETSLWRRHVTRYGSECFCDKECEGCEGRWRLT